MDAEDVMDISDTFNVTAVPFLVLRRGEEVLETVSGSDATKVRTAIEKHVSTSSTSTASKPATSANASTASTKNLSNYAPTAQDPATAPEYSSGEVKETKEELHKRLTTLVKAAPVMLFMKGTPSAPQCGFSRQTVAILRENSVKYGFFNILADDEVRQGLKEFAEWPTFPQLWVDGELVGGLDIVSFGSSVTSCAISNDIIPRSRKKLPAIPTSSKHTAYLNKPSLQRLRGWIAYHLDA